MNQGIIIKAYNSFYYVQQPDAVVMCTLRGRFKKERFSLLVGDEVQFSLLSDGKGVIETILPRRSLLKRPLVANVEQVILTFAAASPDISRLLLDRFLVLAESSQLDIVLCINKSELGCAKEIGALTECYRQIGYKVIEVSAKTGQGLEELRKTLSGRVSVFSGPSGVGKSSLLNALQPGLNLMTGEVSDKIGRGKHTTRHAELMPLQGGGFVVDTPGFSLAEITDIAPDELRHWFREFVEETADCRFSSCLHLHEPACGVKDAVAAGRIDALRYENYVSICNENKVTKKGF